MSLLTGLIIILSLGLCPSFVAGPSFVWSEVPVVLSDDLRHQSEVLNVLWTVVILSSPRYYTCHWINVSPSGPEPSLLSDVCQTVHSVGSFHLPCHLPFRLPCRLPFPFHFLSYPPPQTSAKIFLGDTSCNQVFVGLYTSPVASAILIC